MCASLRLHLWKLMSWEICFFFFPTANTHTSSNRYVYTYADVRESILLCECIHSKQSLSHLQETISSLASTSVMFPALIWLQLTAAEKLFQHSELREGAGVISLLGDAFLSHPLSLYSTCSVSRWDQEGGALEGKGRVQHRHARSGKRGRWGRRREMGEGGGLCMEDISPCLKPDSRHSLSWFDFLLCRSTYSAHCNGCWVWTWTWQREVKGISHF